MIHVTIDPGHARGSDKHGCDGFSEQAHNLLMAKALKAKLESVGISVTLTRDNEISDPTLTQCGRTAKGMDLFLSMHTNGASGKARGVTVFYSVDLPGDKAPALELVQAIAKALDTPVRGAVTRPGTNDPTEDYYTVIDSAQDAGCKHVFLSESGFHDNPQDCAAMRTPEGIEAIAEAHAVVLCKLLGVTYPAQKPDRGDPDRPAYDPKEMPPLKLGSKGEWVKLAQELLVAKGYQMPKSVKNGQLNGVFWIEMNNRVKAFQRDHGLEVDAKIGFYTWTALLS